MKNVFFFCHMNFLLFEYYFTFFSDLMFVFFLVHRIDDDDDDVPIVTRKKNLKIQFQTFKNITFEKNALKFNDHHHHNNLIKTLIFSLPLVFFQIDQLID